MRRESLEILSHFSFALLLAFMAIFTFGTALQNIDIGTALIAATLYFLGIRFKRFDPISSAWLILGTDFVLSFVTLNPLASPLSSVSIIIVFIAAYEFSRFQMTMKQYDIVKGSDPVVISILNRVQKSFYQRFVETLAVVVSVSLVAVVAFELLPTAPIDFAFVFALTSLGIIVTLIIVGRNTR